MRSVFFHLTGTTRSELAEWLSAVADTNGPEGWCWPPSGAEPRVLSIGFYDELLAENEPPDIEMLTASLGALPDVTVAADISGRVPGDVEIREFAALVLGRFRGVARDDYTSHCWSLAEIQSGAKVADHAFFDYDGWYQERQNRLRPDV